MYRLYLIKRIIEDVFIYPFILTGRLIAFLNPLKKDYRIYFFFPFYHTGGAEKIHVQIAQACGGRDCIIFFTRKSADNRFLQDFKNTGCDMKDISEYTDNKWVYFLNLIYRGILSGYINRQKQNPVIFNGQCNIGYKISPWIKKSIRQVELIHSLNTFSYIRIPFLPFIHRTVMISLQRIGDHKNLYQRFKIPLELATRIIYIPNAIPIGSGDGGERSFLPFTILYAGRPGPEKRIHLILEMARELNKEHKDVQFEMIGDMSSLANPSVFPFVKFHGNVKSDKTINSIYSRAHVLLLTSSTEGFPLVVIEAMANGCAVIATPVGDIPFHVKNETNGFLFSSADDESAIVKEGCEKILWLKNNPGHWKAISETNRKYARDHFGLDAFNSAYRNLLK